MASLKVLVFPPPEHANWFGNGTIQRNTPTERVIAQRRPPANKIRRNKPRTIPFPCQPEMSPGPFCPARVPWAGAVHRCAHVWKNDLTAADRQLWQGKACEVGQDRKPSSTPTRNGWNAFLAAAMYAMWYRVWAGYLLNTDDLPLSNNCTIQAASESDQEIWVRFYWDEGAYPTENNVMHCFQIDPNRLESNVPWAFTRASGQASTWLPESETQDVHLHAAYPFVAGEKVGIYVRETAGMTSWARYVRFTTAIA